MGAESWFRANAIWRATAVRENKSPARRTGAGGQGAEIAPFGRLAEMKRGWAGGWWMRLLHGLSGDCALELIQTPCCDVDNFARVKLLKKEIMRFQWNLQSRMRFRKCRERTRHQCYLLTRVNNI